MEGSKPRSLAGKLDRQRVNIDAAPRAVKADLPVDQSIKCVITSAADVLAGVKLGANLADDDAACGDGFSAESLDAATLAVAIATVAAAALAFFMCHDRN